MGITYSYLFDLNFEKYITTINNQTTELSFINDIILTQNHLGFLTSIGTQYDFSFRNSITLDFIYGKSYGLKNTKTKFKFNYYMISLGFIIFEAYSSTT